MNHSSSPSNNSQGKWAPRATRADIRNITVREAVDEYLDHLKREGKSTREHRSILKGAENRVHGVAPAGDALCQTYLATMKMRRVDWQTFAQWFDHRHPLTLAPSSRKRGMSSMRGFLKFCIERGYADRDVMHACGKIDPSNPRRYWLRPQMIRALTPLLQNDRFDAMDRFAWDLMLSTGARVGEVPGTTTDDLNRHDRTLHLLGKGRGQGKPRDVPVDEDFMSRFDAYVEEMHIAEGGYLFFYRQFAQAKGQPQGVIAQVGEDRTRPIGTKPIYKMTVALKELAQEMFRNESPELIPAHLSPHVLRHTYGCLHTIAAEINADGEGTALGMESLRQAMGHESLSTTAAYLGDVAAFLGRYRKTAGTQKTVDNILGWVEKQSQDRRAS